MRLDQKLVELGLCPTRSKAQDLIRTEGVLVSPVEGAIGDLVFKPSFQVQEQMVIQLKFQQTLKYVSRAGLKLEGALKRLSLNVQGWSVLDVGQSTGGFTQCLLEAGAESVVGIEVGHSQLDKKLRNHPKVTTHEKTNAQELPNQQEFKGYKELFDLAVMDVSFTSMTKILPALHWALKPKGILLSLVKPQFELDANQLNKKGIVKDPLNYDIVSYNIKAALEDFQFQQIQYFESIWAGKDGNREFFIFGKKD